MTIVNYDTPSFCVYTAFHTHATAHLVSILTSSVHTKNGFIPNPMPQFSQITQACYRYIPTFFLSIKPLANLRFVVKVLKNPCTLLAMK